jgi:hypothetical protein
MLSITHERMKTQLTTCDSRPLKVLLVMFAAIAHDGTRDVVVGTGSTEDSARADAKFLLDSMSQLLPNDPLTIKRVAAITDAQYDRIREGVHDCLLLKIPGSV